MFIQDPSLLLNEATLPLSPICASDAKTGACALACQKHRGGPESEVGRCGLECDVRGYLKFILCISRYNILHIKVYYI